MERILGRFARILTFTAILIGAPSSAFATMVLFDYQGTLTWQTGYYGPAAAEGTALDPFGSNPPCEAASGFSFCAPLPTQTLVGDFSLTFRLPAEIVDQDGLGLPVEDFGTEWFATGLITQYWNFSGSTGDLSYMFATGSGANNFPGIYYCADSNEGEPPGPLECYPSEAYGGASFIPTDAAALVSLLSAIATSPGSFNSLDFTTTFSGQILAERFDAPIGYIIPGTEYVDAAGTLRVTLVPVPATLALFGLGLAGIGYKRRKQIKAA